MSTFDRAMNDHANKLKVKVTKPDDRLDDRLSLCGEDVRHENGEQFFIIPAHQADYQKAMMPHYIFGEPFDFTAYELKKKLDAAEAELEAKRGPGRPKKED